MARLTLVLGGARSGKSARALALCPPPRLFVATAEPLDAEMAERIARHRADRAQDWTVVEAPLELAGAIRAEAREARTILVDCLTLWLSNLLHAGREPESETEALLAALGAAPGRAVLVSNEVGMGLAPMNALGRAFRDAQGRLNQRVAAAADRVEFVAAGLPLVLKGGEPPA
jgi:adenosylcobinamide kinase/adenosylcobinamide-phosphate guanylyltransferase